MAPDRGSQNSLTGCTALFFPEDEVTRPGTVKPSETPITRKKFQGAGAAANAGGRGQRRGWFAAVPLRSAWRGVEGRDPRSQTGAAARVPPPRPTAATGSVFFPMGTETCERQRPKATRTRVHHPPETRSQKPRSRHRRGLRGHRPFPFPPLHGCTSVSAVTAGPRRHHWQLGAYYLAASPSPRPSRCC